jgi:murein DD-endopeptidase MepM/ murein hydrolase activator NlpD
MTTDQKGILPILLLIGGAILSLGATSKSRFRVPLRGRITSGFGERINPITKVKEFHNGIDIVVPEGTPVVAPENGEVVNVYKTDIGGNQIVLKHNSGYVSGYAHLLKPLVKIKDKISRGQVIALSGKTGQVTGAHLHFSLRDPSGKYVDPEEVLPFA